MLAYEQTDEQNENAEEAFYAWSNTWNLADMTPRDIFNAGFFAGVNMMGKTT